MDLVVLGDSVVWGQGLLAQHKFATLVATSLSGAYPGLSPTILAHSGAVIGNSDGNCAGTTSDSGEVPLSCPSIFQQVSRYAGDVNSVPLVIVNGGINDIDFRTILNPFTNPTDLASDITQYCETVMIRLLGAVATKFPSATTKIVVTSYFPILSTQSRPFGIPFLLECFGLTTPSFVNPLDAYGKIIALCSQFYNQSNAALCAAVKALNQTLGATRAFFAQPAFTGANSVFAPDPWLFGLSDLLAAEDEVAGTRATACDVTFKDDLLGREQCLRASAGHPNVTGAARFAAAILNAIGQP